MSDEQIDARTGIQKAIDVSLSTEVETAEMILGPWDRLILQEMADDFIARLKKGMEARKR